MMWPVQCHAACLFFVSVLVDFTVSFSPVHIYPLKTSHQVFLDLYTLDFDRLYLGNFPMTAYPLFPNGQGKKPPNAVTGCVSGEETADTLVPFLLFLSVTCTRSGEVSGSVMDFI